MTAGTTTAPSSADRLTRILEATASGPMSGFLRTQRWFSTDGRPVARITLRDHALIEPASATRPAYVLALFDVAREEGEASRAKDAGARETYAIPLVVGTGGAGDADSVIGEVTLEGAPITVADALADERYARALLAAIARASTFPTARGGAVVATRAASMLGHIGGGAIEAIPVRFLRASGEASAIVFCPAGQDRVVLESARRLDDAAAVEVELAGALHRAGFTGAPPLLGDLAYLAPKAALSAPITLAIAREHVPYVSDGWGHALADLHAVLSSSLRSSRKSKPTTRASSQPPRVPHAATARQLGALTAAMHHALASERHDAAFAPEPFTERHLAKMIERVIERVNDALEAARPLSELPAEVRSSLAELEARATRLDAQLAALPSPKGMLSSRVRGDHQLRRVLRTDRGWAIVDLEGARAHALGDVRRAKVPPVADVATMLRSYDYAASFAAQEALAAEPQPPTADVRAEVARLAEAWRDAARASFVDGYAESAGATLMPAEEGARRRWIALHELDVALQELAFELRHRPEWVAVPLRATLRALTDALAA